MDKYEAIEKYESQFVELKKLKVRLNNSGFSVGIINDGKFEKCLMWFNHKNQSTNSFRIFVDEEGFSTHYIQVANGRAITDKMKALNSVEDLIAFIKEEKRNEK